MPPPQGAWNPIEGPADYTFTSQVHSHSYAAISPLKANLAGKSVFITGASRGLGRAIAIAYARAGCTQIAIGARSDLSATEAAVREAAREAKRGGPDVQVLNLRLDLGDEKSVQSAVEEISAKFGGKLDVVVNNAGILSGRGKIGETVNDDWWNNFVTNLRGPYLIARACIPLLQRGELKTIATVASVGAHCITPALSGYQTSKLAVLRLTEFIAAEYADEGFTTFTIHPGNILTDIVGNGEGMDEKLKAVFTESPDLCADSLVFLTGVRRQWLNGRYVNVTWDLPELVSEAKKKEIVERDLLKVRLAV